MRKVLVIAYIFPPLGGSGVQRTAKFVKYLPELGWLPLVVCGDDPGVGSSGLDPTLLAEVPAETRVWRRRFLSPHGPRRWLQQRLGIMPKSANSSSDSGGSELEARPAGGTEGLSRARKILGVLSAAVSPLEFPPVDSALYWALSIAPLCRRIVTREDVDVIYTTSFPYSDHVTGLILKWLTGKPWVADFRDPWTQNAAAGNADWRRRVDCWVERQVLRHADRVIGVTPTYTAGLRSLAPGRDSGDFVTIENGFDQEDFPGGSVPRPSRPEGEATTLAHVGMVYEGTAVPLLRALAQVPAARDRLKLRFVGGLAGEEQAWLGDHPLQAQVEVCGRVSHGEAIREMQAADALLLPIGGQPAWRGHYPGKLFEYMNSGTPILLMGPDGDAADLVRASGTGCSVLVDDGEAIASALRLLATQPAAFRARYYQPRPDVIARYERHALAARLAAVFDELATSEGSG